MKALYPDIQIALIKSPNRFYAVPLLGFFIKVVMIVPVALELWVLKLAQFLFSILNSLNIFFRGRYWKIAYELNLGIMQLETNVSFFLFGLTDVYPGFSLHPTMYQLSMNFNKSPNRVLATPLLGMFFRLVLMIPYVIYSQVVSIAAFLAAAVGWESVLFNGRYPETVYEIVRDSVRVSQASNMYFLGMSDAYPSFWISLNHKTLKIILLVVASLIFLMNFSGRFFAPRHTNMQPTQAKMHQQIQPSYSY